jgi:streptogramin lyase
VTRSSDEPAFAATTMHAMKCHGGLRPAVRARARGSLRRLPLQVLAVALALSLFTPALAQAAVNAVNTGDLLVANYAGDSVVRIAPTTGLMWNLGTFVSPTDLAMTTDGYVYVTERDGLVRRLNLINGSITTVNAASPLPDIWGIVIGPANQLYVTSRSTHGIIRVDPGTGVATPLVHSQGGADDWPVGIDLADPSHAVVAFYNRDRIVSVALDTETPPVTLATSASGVNLPWGIAISGGFVYCADQDTHHLQRFPLAGGSLTDVHSLLGLPFGFDLDAVGNVVVSTISPDEVRVVRPDGTMAMSYPGGLLTWGTGVEVATATIPAPDQVNTPPLLDPIPDRSVPEGLFMTLTAAASDSNWPPQQLTFSLIEPFPDGSRIAPNGAFTWTPKEEQGPLSYLFRVKVADDGQPSLTATQTFTITVTEVNLAPSITPIANQQTTVGFPVAFTASATDPDLPSQGLSFRLLNGPPGASLTSAGAFTWTPTSAQGGSNYVMSIVVTDDANPPRSATNTFSISVSDVNVPPVLSPLTDQTVDEGNLLVYSIAATDANRPPQTLTFTLEPGAPAGAQISPTGSFTWRPAEADGPGQYTIGVRVTDSGIPSLSDTDGFVVTVREVNAAPTLAYIGTYYVEQGSPLTFTAAAADADLPPGTITWSLDPGAPNGAQVSQAGVFSWTPAETDPAGAYTITLRVADNASPPLSASRTFTVHVTPAPLTIEIGDILVADFFGNSVIKINPQTGAQRTVGLFNSPTDLALSTNGSLYVSEWGGFIKRLDVGSQNITVVNPDTAVSDVWGLALGPGGELFVTSLAGESVVRIDPGTGTESYLTQSNLLSSPYGIDLLDAGHLVVSSAFSNRLVSVALADGVQTLIVEGQGLDSPSGLAVSGSDIFVAGYGPRQLQRVSSGSVHAVYPLPEGWPAGVAVAPDGSIYLGTTGLSPNQVLRLSPQGALLDTHSGGLLSEITGIEVSSIRVGPLLTNSAPVLDPIGNRNVDEGTLLSLTITASDANLPFQSLLFTIDPGAPPGASITPSGQFSWLPSEVSGPGSYPITVRVTDNATTPLSDTDTFTVVVNEVNAIPVWDPIPRKDVSAGSLLTFSLTASDSDIPAQTLVFSLEPGPAVGASVSPGGTFTWTPTPAQAPSTNTVVVRVTDNGTPVRSATSEFTVVVHDVNTPPAMTPIAPVTVNEGSLLAFLVTVTDTDRPAQTLTFSLGAGAPPGAGISAAGVFSWTPDESQGPGSHSIPVIVVDSGLPPLGTTNVFQVTVNEVNAAPVLADVPQQTIMVSNLLSFAIAASDADEPAQPLTFDLLGTPPPGVTLSPAGVFTWTPLYDQAPRTYDLTWRVRDNGVPPLSATQTVSMVVRPQFVLEVGDVLVANYVGNSVLRLDPQTGAQQVLDLFELPTDLVLAPDGLLYLSEWGGLVKRLNLTNGLVTVVNPGTALTEVWGIALGTDGRLFVTCSADDAVVAIDPLTGSEEVVSRGNLLQAPAGIDFLDAGQLVVSSSLNNRLVAVALTDGTQTLIAEDEGLGFPWGVAVSGATVYAAAYDSQLIQRVSGGLAETFYLLESGWPAGLAVTSQGELFCGVTEPGADRLLRIGPQGNLLQTYSGGAIGEITGIEIARSRVGPQTTPNAPPVAGNDSIDRNPTNGTKVLIATLLGNDSDPEGGPIHLFSLSPTSVQGGAVYPGGDWVFYTPPAGLTSDDSFTYLVADGHFALATGTVTIRVNPDLVPSPNLVLIDQGNGSFLLRFDGIPGTIYRIQYAQNLSAPVWQTLGSNMADPFGTFVFTDTPPAGSPERFYRSIYP